MHAADFLIGKPGPGSIAEAMISGLPVLVECNSSTLPQERYNTEWVVKKQVGVVVTTLKNAVPAVRSLLEPGKLPALQHNVKSLRNRAVFEIADFLASKLQENTDPYASVPIVGKISR